MKILSVIRNLLLVSTVALVACQSSAQEPVEFAQASIVINDKPLTVEFANTQEQRARGMMYRKSLCDDCGMLFYFSPPRQASMWMKNTYVALDVAFIDRNGVITDIKPLMPHDLTSVGASKVVTYALEMNQGWFAANNVHVGDQISVNL
ncbi:DUF192 domain-containing protein [Alteromonas sp. C1M14]|uniref:DUF192 domain-containing protein n=1 Tax=Alteromonas sp. C1M14 TaxID=2841567 RepID=UPI001C089701|nr:DUF192 domain-containing protein [Alteromonas sp. C1M14]MBU2977647.1 DUF192 domain-containing protein [Alteromonas sp. C1M14]